MQKRTKDAGRFCDLNASGAAFRKAKKAACILLAAAALSGCSGRTEAVVPGTPPAITEPSETVLPPASGSEATPPPATKPEVISSLSPTVSEGSETRTPATQPPVTSSLSPTVSEGSEARTPVTQSPVTQPPVTQPLVIQPPATQMPATQMPATQLPATQMPATQLPATQLLSQEVSVTPTGQAGTVPTQELGAETDDALFRLVGNGWQQAADVSGTYQILFPEYYDRTAFFEEEDGFSYYYTSSEYADTSFQIRCFLETSYEFCKEQIAVQYPGVQITEAAGEERFDYVWSGAEEYAEGTVYACYYAQTGTNGAAQAERRYSVLAAEDQQGEAHRWYLCR